jgi:hypothetical protein
VVDEHGHVGVCPHVRQPLQPPRALGLLVDGGEERVPLESERDGNEVQTPVRRQRGEAGHACPSHEFSHPSGRHHEIQNLTSQNFYLQMSIFRD